VIELPQPTVVRIPLDPDDRPSSLTVVPARTGADTETIYRRYRAQPAVCRDREPVVAIVAAGVLSTPDRLEARSARRDEALIVLEVDQLSFDGPLRANVLSLALVRLELGVLQQGGYRLILRKSVRHFTDPERPDHVTEPDETEEPFDFACGA
jgi:hypothetical protein